MESRYADRLARELEVLGKREQQVALSPKPLLRIERVAIAGAPAVLRRRNGRNLALFSTPNSGVGNVVIRVAAKLRLTDPGSTSSRSPTKSELFKLGLKKAWLKLNDGVTTANGDESAVAADGSFELVSRVTTDSRRITLQVVVDRKSASAVSAPLELELIDLEGFLALVDAEERRLPGGVGGLAFLASVRKVFQGGPGNPLEGLFNRILFRSRKVTPLFAPKTEQHELLASYQVLSVAGEAVDISHVLTGIEGMPKQDPSQGQTGNIPPEPELIVTWQGDLGSALYRYAARFITAADTGEPVDIRDDLGLLAGRPDLLGDVDGVNVGAVYDSSKSLRANLEAYYARAVKKRFTTFLANSRQGSSRSNLLAITPAKKLTAQARTDVARRVAWFYAIKRTLTGIDAKVGPAKADVLRDLQRADSPEMQMVLDHFAEFVERGLAKEP